MASTTPTGSMLQRRMRLLQTLPKGERVRVVEIGSGSGGTSAVVMAALADHGDRVSFAYTDLSPQLVAYGRRTYGSRFAFARFHVLDIERDLAPQVWCQTCACVLN